MKLSITLLTALVGAVTAIPSALVADSDATIPDPQPGVPVPAAHLEVLMKRNECVPANKWLCERPGESACVCNQGKTVGCSLPIWGPYDTLLIQSCTVQMHFC
jgi:hypothetical protein